MYFTRDIIRILFPVHILSTLFFSYFPFKFVRTPKKSEVYLLLFEDVLRESARPHILYKSRVTDHTLARKTVLPYGCG